MGLDSFLYVKQEHPTKTLRQVLELAKTDTKLQEAIGEDMETLKELAQEEYIDTSHQVAYWRKANQIHNFFIQECAGGDEDTSSVYVCMEDIKELIKRCKKIIKTVEYRDDWIADGALYGSAGNELFYLDDGSVLKLSEIRKLAQDNDTRLSFLEHGEEPVIQLWSNLEQSKKAICHFNKTKSSYVEFFILGKVIANPEIAEELLPTVSGFFFGSTDYDEYYIQDLKDTINQLKPLTKKKYPPYTSFRYEASW